MPSSEPRLDRRDLIHSFGAAAGLARCGGGGADGGGDG